MLLAVYGMRSGEVRSLCLEDIDWDNDRLQLRRSKTSRTQILRLSATVGSEILRYLRDVRPYAAVREVF
jgi:integrase